MFKIRAPDGSNNLCGRWLTYFREAHKPRYSQRKLAEELQRRGYDVDHHFIRRIENGERFVTDIELALLAEVLEVSVTELLEGRDLPDGADAGPAVHSPSWPGWKSR